MENIIIGRIEEIQTLQECLDTSPRFIAVYGRRRVGKTFLIREFFAQSKAIIFEVSGQHSGDMKTQLSLFRKALEKSFYNSTVLPEFSDWNSAFQQLYASVKLSIREHPNRPHLIFLDELPWLYTRKSGLIQALDHIWNSELSRIPEVKLVVCGSAASWMIKNIVSAKGGLHNRLTNQISLKPFKLDEVRELLLAKGIEYSEQHLIDTYMVFGGVPYYLSMIRKEESPSLAISRLCFSGPLKDEFSKLFKALFDNGDVHEELVKAMASKRRGLTRKDLLKEIGAKSGGRLTNMLQELEEAGFITQLPSYVGNSEERTYRVIDCFVLFHQKWIAPSLKGIMSGNENDFILEQNSQKYQVWSGTAFENVVFQHIPHIKKSLGLTAIKSRAFTWETAGDKKNGSLTKGAQIDLVFERSDGVVNLCEIKYYDKKFTIDKSYADNLQNKIDRYREIMGLDKTIMLVIISASGLTDNDYARRLVSRIVSIKDFLKPL